MKRLVTILFILVSSPCLAAPDDMARAMQVIRPGAQWTITGTDCATMAWLDAVQVQPTCTEINNAIAALPTKDPVIDAIDIVTLKVAFNHENRIRALEGKAAITIAQFKAALKLMP